MNRVTLLLTQGLNKKVLHFLVELLCIVIAVTLSFYLDDLREDRKDKEVLKGIIASLIVDIEVFTNDYRNGSAFASASMDTIDLCMRLAQEHKPIPDLALETFIFSISGDHSSDLGTSSSYVGLLSSGVWQELPDSIRRSVFDLYEYNYGFAKVTIDRVSDYCAHLKTSYFPKYHIDFFNVKDAKYKIETRDGNKTIEYVTKALIDPEFRSALIVARNTYHRAVRYQNEAVASGEKTVARLKAYLQKLSPS